MFWTVGVLAVGFLVGFALLRWGTRWGSTPGERASEMAGDEFVEGGPQVRVPMTRAISIGAPPERVWPWIAQLGRGAGWYSIDWLDNGGEDSAWHIVSWIPEPRLGDATAIGYLRHLERGRALAWWADGVPFAGARSRLVCSYLLVPEGQGTRLVSRMSADATGLPARLALLVFQIIDSIMAIRHLLGIRDRVEYRERHPETPRDPESGDRDQYQLSEVIYASGDRAGAAGKEHSSRWRQIALKDGVLRNEDETA